ncbi:PucR family transcriptional regulator ligand-binding domain-containing protein [Leucobacter denitrificans]|uniref:PucR family transcriptional regulator ligand-binding domain-containing protein n=1 Tax=Leucobacter denitrificans TaxID=683042 RepID=A0A7G9S6E6_9MICO|nr:PucR family transcriptional regulator ligand-binding domain-containing protein [Leucobacter denitrificans]QNN63421.1 PucR family transcriptional regulator ligand-binding domain-containing protein [Leucobacter denitrificans]
MALSLRKLLLNPSLHLRVLVGGDDGDDATSRALDREFEWLHATDLIDPTQFLGPAEVILTLGWQFPITDPADESIPVVRKSNAEVAEIYENYAALIAAHGVIGVGFGSDVIHRGVPRGLEDACRRHGLILFDVPYEISFMDLLQEAARIVQRDQSDRSIRSLRAQKAIANAATRRDGLTATLRETARQLGCGVALYDPLGRPVTTVDPPDGRNVREDELTPIVQRTLASGHRFHSVQAGPELEVVLQLLGESNHPSGMLALTLSRGFDDVSRNVLSSVLALVSVSLEQNQALTSLHGTLREALLQLMVTGNVSVTRHISESLWGNMPEPPLVALVGISQSHEAAQLLPALEPLHLEEDLPIFFAQWHENLALLARDRDVDRVIAHLDDLDLVIGRSRCDRWEGLELALEEAERAATYGERKRSTGVTLFSEIWSEGLTDLIDASEAAHVARRLLGPLQILDAERGGELITTLRVWQSHFGKGLVDLDSMVTDRIKLEDVNAAFAEMRQGRGIRSVIEY